MTEMEPWRDLKGLFLPCPQQVVLLQYQDPFWRKAWI